MSMCHLIQAERQGDHHSPFSTSHELLSLHNTHSWSPSIPLYLSPPHPPFLLPCSFPVSTIPVVFLNMNESSSTSNKSAYCFLMSKTSFRLSPLLNIPRGPTWWRERESAHERELRREREGGAYVRTRTQWGRLTDDEIYVISIFFAFYFLTMCIRSHWQNSAPIRPPPPSYQSPFNPNLPHPRTQTFSPPPPPPPLPLPQRPGRSHHQLAQPYTTLGSSLAALIYPLPPSPLIDPTPA